MSAGVSLPHKDTIDSGSEQPERYYRPNPTPIILARESERHREGGRAEDEVIPNSAHPGSLPHYRGTEIKSDGAGLQELDVRGVQERDNLCTRCTKKTHTTAWQGWQMMSSLFHMHMEPHYRRRKPVSSKC